MPVYTARSHAPPEQRTVPEVVQQPALLALCRFAAPIVCDEGFCFCKGCCGFLLYIRVRQMDFDPFSRQGCSPASPTALK